jgi:hypothetical protein
MEQHFPFHESLSTAKMLIEQGKDNAFIEEQLVKKGIDSTIITEVLKQVKHIRKAKRTKNGTYLILLGVFLLGLGFICCILLSGTGTSIDFALYGLTAIGAIILVAGLAMIFH